MAGQSVGGRKARTLADVSITNAPPHTAVIKASDQDPADNRARSVNSISAVKPQTPHATSSTDLEVSSQVSLLSSTALSPSVPQSLIHSVSLERKCFTTERDHQQLIATASSVHATFSSQQLTKTESIQSAQSTSSCEPPLALAAPSTHSLQPLSEANTADTATLFPMGVLSSEGRPILQKSFSVAFGSDSTLEQNINTFPVQGHTSARNNIFPRAQLFIAASSASSPCASYFTQIFDTNVSSLEQLEDLDSPMSKEPEVRVLRRSESEGFGFSRGKAQSVETIPPVAKMDSEGDWKQWKIPKRPSLKIKRRVGHRSSFERHRALSEESSSVGQSVGTSSHRAPVSIGHVDTSCQREVERLTEQTPTLDTDSNMDVSSICQSETSAQKQQEVFISKTDSSDTDCKMDMYTSEATPNNSVKIGSEVSASKPSTSAKPVPSLRRQLSRRRSHQEATAGPSPSAIDAATNVAHADDSSFGDLKGREEEGDGGSPSTTPPGSPSAKSRRVDMSYDPYQVFEVQHLPCMILTVKVLRGRNISNGWAQDLIDTPDPYVNLRMKTAPEGRKRTRTIDNEVNPIWNESFDFYLNFQEKHVLEIALMEANPLGLDQTIGTVYFNVTEGGIRDIGQNQTEVFNFNGTCEVDIEFHLDWDQNPTLRYSLCLSDKEKEFMRKRKEKVFEGLKQFLGDRGPRTADEAPTVAVIGSGGGFRAMTGYSGVFKALANTGLLDCTTYACGLSGSSWYLSTLYSHPRWPQMNPGDLQDELKHNIDKSLIRLLGLSSVRRYLGSVLKKRKDGQPISFTDFFGHLVGETLLKGRMNSRLTDQRAKIQDAEVPMPLYTCVHVKKDVPARSFQEWVEFSPYEIGMPKYGTFMDSELFGSKFFMGKLVHKYEEQPLHFLQGIWGSAFCILFKRLLDDNRRIDPAEMIRQEMGKQLEQTQDNDDDSSDLSDEEDDEDDTTESEGSDMEQDGEKTEEAKEGGRRLSGSDSGSSVSSSSRPMSSESRSQERFAFGSRRLSTESSDTTDGESSFTDLGPPPSFLGEDNSSDSTGFADPRTPTPFDQSQAADQQQSRKSSLSNSSNSENGLLSCSPKKEVRFCQGVDSFEKRREIKQQKQAEQLQRRQHGQKPKPGLKRMQSARRGKSRGYWSSMLKGIFENKKYELLSTRAGRAAVIHNFMRGLSLQQTYPLSPFTPVHERVQEGDEFDGNFEMYPTHIKHIYMVDAGLTFNSPFPLVLRPQRGVDVILSFDFSARPSDSTPPFKELLLAEKWAKLNRLPFPPIDETIVNREGLKELYVFRDPNDPHCPVVLHFCLININFRKFSAPGVPRETDEEIAFADFDIFDDPTTPYSTFNFTYKHEQYERLAKLMEFNTLNNIVEVKEVLAEVVARKRNASPRQPIHTRDIKLLRMKSVQEKRELKKFMKKMECNAVSKTPTPTGTEPPTPFFTPTPLDPVHVRNPFVFRNSGPGSKSSSTGSQSSSNDSKYFSSQESTKSDPKSSDLVDSGFRSSSSSSPEEASPFFKILRQDSVTKHRNGNARTPSHVHNNDNYAKQILRWHGATEFNQQTSSELHPHSDSSFTGFPKDSSDDVFHLYSQTNKPLVNSYIKKNVEMNSHSTQPVARQESEEFGDFRQTSATVVGSSRQDSRLSRGSSEDEFFDAVETFTRDDEPVTDPKLAKMHYEGAKQRRKLLRRQSTISSLNSITESISLDSDDTAGHKSRQDSQLSTISRQSEPIDVADLEQFQGITSDQVISTYTSDGDKDHDFVNHNWFDLSQSPQHRSTVVQATGNDCR